MQAIAFLLCVLTKQVTSQSNDIFPARILAQQKAIRENSDLYVTCTTFGFKKNMGVFVYLCKDGLGTKAEWQKPDQNDTVFSIPRVGLHHSGNYSCVYSKTNYTLYEVVKEGHNIIQILVIDISVAGPSTISEGDDVDFRCAVSPTLQTLDKCQLIQTYLTKNETILQVQAFNVTRMEATFSIKGAVMRDSGHYSCVVLPSKCIEEHSKTLYGNNVVSLQVQVSMGVWVFISCGVTSLMLLLCLCLWWIRKKTVSTGHSAACNSCAAKKRPSINMFEEQQEQTEGEELDSQDRESFSSDEEVGYENNQVAEDFTYSDDCEEEGVYSVADDAPERSASTGVYAKSFKRKLRSSSEFTVS